MQSDRNNILADFRFWIFILCSLVVVAVASNCSLLMAEEPKFEHGSFKVYETHWTVDVYNRADHLEAYKHFVTRTDPYGVEFRPFAPDKEAEADAACVQATGQDRFALGHGMVPVCVPKVIPPEYAEQICKATEHKLKSFKNGILVCAKERI